MHEPGCTHQAAHSPVVVVLDPNLVPPVGQWSRGILLPESVVACQARRASESQWALGGQNVHGVQWVARVGASSRLCQQQHQLPAAAGDLRAACPCAPELSMTSAPSTYSLLPSSEDKARVQPPLGANSQPV